MKAQIEYRGYKITWFPLEQKWMCFKDLKSLGNFMNTSKECKIYIDKRIKENK